MLIECAAGHVQRMQKAMTQMNLQLHHVISDITGWTGMKIIRAIVGGERNPQRLAALKHERTRVDEQTIAKALEGDYRPEHLFALKQCLESFDNYQKQIEECHGQIAQHLKTLESKADPQANQPRRPRKSKGKRNQPAFDVREQAFRISGVDLTGINGISESAALGIIAEIGINMNAWKTEKHFASWLTLCPNNKISGGKVLQRSTRQSANRVRDILCLCAQSLINSRSALGAFCRRLRARLGAPKAIVATAHKLALLVYRMLKFGRDYVDIGQHRYDEKFKERSLRSLARKAQEFGFQLVPTPAEIELVPKELGFQGRVPTENQNLVPCARAVVEDVPCIVVHIVLDRYPCTRVQTSACGKPGQLVCGLLQRCLSVFLNAHTSVDCKRRVRCDCSTNFAHTTEESRARDWRICVSTGAIFCRH
jgi:transposase